MTVHRTLRARLTLTYVALLVACTAAVLGVSWWLLHRHLARTLPGPYADSVLADLAGQYVLAIAGAGLLALGVGWIAAGHALAPVRAIARTAARIPDERLDARVRLPAPAGPGDEVHELAATLDAMLDRIASSVEAQRRFVANASHELRTPLTVIRTEAEVALDDARARRDELRAALHAVVEASERAEDLLDGLLVLAATTRAARRDEPLDLSHVARRALAAGGGDAGWDARLEAVTVRGDAALLERLVGNLVENALRHGRPGDRPALLVRADAGDALVRVTNAGEPIAPAMLERLVQPFERAGRSGQGAGLGLSIVDAIAEAHGGDLALARRPQGGLEATVRLPLAA